jgi:ribonuclease HI
MSAYEIWTDGSCLGNPGPGGWAVLIRFGGTEKELSGGERDSTNNRMELMAAIQALESLPEGAQAIVYADSQYVGDGIQKWIHGWKRNGWKTAAKAPVKNGDLWKRLDAARNRVSVEWRWVRGHANSVENNRVDVIARTAAGAAR